MFPHSETFYWLLKYRSITPSTNTGLRKNPLFARPPVGKGATHMALPTRLIVGPKYDGWDV